MTEAQNNLQQNACDSLQSKNRSQQNGQNKVLPSFQFFRHNYLLDISPLGFKYAMLLDIEQAYIYFADMYPIFSKLLSLLDLSNFKKRYSTLNYWNDGRIIILHNLLVKRA